LTRQWRFVQIQPKALALAETWLAEQRQLEATLPAVLQSLTVLDRAVAASGYLAGRQFTLADLYPLPVLAYLRALPEGCAAVEREKNLNSYFETHSQRASFRNTVPPPLQDLERVRAAIS
jgi:glutathione S-transferase